MVKLINADILCEMSQMSNGCVTIAAFTRTAADRTEQSLISAWVRGTDISQSGRLDNAAISQRFLLGRALARAAVSRLTGQFRPSGDIVTDPHGKPVFRSASGIADPAISISHSGTMIIAAATMIGPLGIDLEFHRSGRPIDDIARFAFGPSERLPACRSVQAFYRTWCLREAMSKAHGKGLAQAADKTDRISAQPETGTWQTLLDGRRWLLAHITPVQDYSVAIAIDTGVTDLTVGWSETSLDLFFPYPEKASGSRGGQLADNRPL